MNHANLIDFFSCSILFYYMKVHVPFSGGELTMMFMVATPNEVTSLNI